MIKLDEQKNKKIIFRVECININEDDTYDNKSRTTENLLHKKIEKKRKIRDVWHPDEDELFLKFF